MEEREYPELRLPLDDDDELATQATINGKKILPPDGYLIGKITHVDNGMLVEYVEQPKYPKTYEECCKVLAIRADWNLTLQLDRNAPCDLDVTNEFDYVYKLESFRKLIICRDAYWKIAGEEMGLGKPWKPKPFNLYHIIICRDDGELILLHASKAILIFPTAEMRDDFYENFKEEIEMCKELL